MLENEQQDIQTIEQVTAPSTSKWARFHLALWAFRIAVLGTEMWWGMMITILNRTDNSKRRRKPQKIPRFKMGEASALS